MSIGGKNIKAHEIANELVGVYPNLKIEQLTPEAGMFRIGAFCYFVSFVDDKDIVIRTLIKDVENHERRINHPVATTQEYEVRW